MEKERLEVVLSNILGELYEKTFECNSDEFLKYLRLEIGLTGLEVYNLIESGLFPKAAGDYFIDILNKDIKPCVDFESENSADCLRSEESEDKYRLEPVTITEADQQMIDVQLASIYHNYFGINPGHK